MTSDVRHEQWAAIFSADLAETQRKVAEAAVRGEAARQARQQAQDAYDLATARVRSADGALAALHTVRDITSARVQQTVAELCSEGLRIVFDDPDVRLEVRPVERRGVVEADLVLIRGGLETDPLDGNGGGLVANASAMLRMVMVRLLAQRGLAPLLVLDEPLAALSAGRREAMAQTLEDVAATLGIQVIVVTHDDTLMRGIVYKVSMADRAASRAVVERED